MGRNTSAVPESPARMLRRADSYPIRRACITYVPGRTRVRANDPSGAARAAATRESGRPGMTTRRRTSEGWLRYPLLSGERRPRSESLKSRTSVGTGSGRGGATRWQAPLRAAAQSERPRLRVMAELAWPPGRTVEYSDVRDDAGGTQEILPWHDPPPRRGPAQSGDARQRAAFLESRGIGAPRADEHEHLVRIPGHRPVDLRRLVPRQAVERGRGGAARLLQRLPHPIPLVMTLDPRIPELLDRHPRELGDVIKSVLVERVEGRMRV